MNESITAFGYKYVRALGVQFTTSCRIYAAL